ncbi:MAG: hypothetical protein JO361_00665 [Gammaproteobacteria bacterium]|nr:hypothetical protein [Gammaproteobacteria bacterium]
MAGIPGVAALAGLAFLALCIPLGHAAPQQALLSYLFAFLFFTGLSAGSLALLEVHALTGGEWGEHLRPQLLAAAQVLPLQAVLVLPILLGLRTLYPWADPAALAHDALLRAQEWYLDPEFFVLRAVGYFALWLTFLVLFGRWSRDPARSSAIVPLAAVGLIAYALSTLLAGADWAMSLLPHWHSSTFGLSLATGWMLAAAALAVLRLMRTGDDAPLPAPGAGVLHDLGNLLLMFVLAWSYLAFMQYLTIWSADQPAETAWYLPRTMTSWRWLAALLIAGHFAVPFAVLLSRRAKRRRSWLASIAALLLLAQLADALWLVVPTFRAQGLSLRWTDLFAPAGMGLLWASVYSSRLKVTSSASWLAHPRPSYSERAHG